MSNKTFPTFVYKILDAPPPSPMPHTLSLSSLDAKDGFIHLSDANQSPITANLFFRSTSTIWLLKISSAKVQEENGRLIWPEGLPGCVHLYGEKKGTWGRLGEGTVVDVKRYEKGESEEWVDAMKEPEGSKWLVDMPIWSLVYHGSDHRTHKYLVYQKNITSKLSNRPTALGQCHFDFGHLWPWRNRVFCLNNFTNIARWCDGD